MNTKDAWLIKIISSRESLLSFLASNGKSSWAPLNISRLVGRAVQELQLATVWLVIGVTADEGSVNMNIFLVLRSSTNIEF